MSISRRNFLKALGVTTVTLTQLGFDLSPAYAQVQGMRTKTAKATPTICPYCAAGCGIIVHTEKGKIINTEGDPDHPINQGSLCSKGSALYQLANNERRLQKPLYRAPKSDKFEEKSWDWVLDKIAANIRNTRDKSFIEKENGITVNRTEAIASLGGAALDNEECYLLQKFMRSLGVVFLEHQARI